MSKSNAKQQFAFLTTLATNANLDQFTTGQLQAGIGNPQEAGREFEAFIRNRCRVVVGAFFRETGELTIQIPALPRPTLEQLQAKYPWIKEIERDNSPTEAITLRLGTVLFPDKTDSINGEEYERRIAPKIDVCLGYQQAVWLVENQDKFPELMALIGEIYIEFPGLVVVRDDGCRSLSCLDQCGSRWCLDWDWLDYDFYQYGRVAVSGK